MRTIEELQDPEYGQVWDRFTARFGFRPGMDRGSWPAIQEPERSVTWSLDALDVDPDDARLDATVHAIRAALRECTAAGDSLLVLDWHHTCYRIWPHAIPAQQRPGWPGSPIPDGDYSILLAEDFSLGTFGHPWEYTICVLGAPLLDRVTDVLDAALVRRVREGGKPARIR